MGQTNYLKQNINVPNKKPTTANPTTNVTQLNVSNVSKTSV